MAEKVIWSLFVTGNAQYINHYIGGLVQRLQYLQCTSTGDTAVLHWATKIMFEKYISRITASSHRGQRVKLLHSLSVHIIVALCSKQSSDLFHLDISLSIQIDGKKIISM